MLSSLLGVHGVQDGLPLGGVALPELLDLPLHHGIQGTEAHLQLVKVQVLQLLNETQTDPAALSKGCQWEAMFGKHARTLLCVV